MQRHYNHPIGIVERAKKVETLGDIGEIIQSKEYQKASKKTQRRGLKKANEAYDALGWMS